MIAILLALFGFARSEIAARTPPILFYLAVFPIAWFAAPVIEALTFLIEWASFGNLTRFWVSVGFRSFGVVATILVAHSLVRVVVFGDDHSYGGWVRRLVLSIRTGA